MEKFGEYIEYLLPSVMKRSKKDNQLLIFCMIIGLVFDDIKTALFLLREESMLATCSDCMLEIAGQDRDMSRMKGESYDLYRRRLMMKAQIAQMSGTLKGIQYALESIGYNNCSIEPLWKTDPDRWAEININFLISSVDDDNTINFRCIVEEVMKVKQAGTLPHYIFHYPTVIQNKESVENPAIILRYVSNFYSGIRYMDGSWLLNGNQVLDEGIDILPAYHRNQCSIENQESVSGTVRIYNNLWYLDGSVPMDGSKIMNAYIKEESLDE